MQTIEQKLSKALFLVPILLFGLVVKLVSLNSSFWLDECVTHWIISSTFSDVFLRSFNYQGQSPLYYILLWGYAALFGTGEVALRIPSAIAIALTIFFLYRMARRYVGVVPAILAGTFFIGFPYLPQLLCARPYAPGLLFVVLSVDALLLYLEERTRARLALYGLWTVGAVGCTYLFAPIIVVHIAAYLFSGTKKNSEAILALVGAVAPAILVGIFGGWQLMRLSSDRPLLFVDLPNWIALKNCYLPGEFGFALLVGGGCGLLALIVKRPIIVAPPKAPLLTFLIWAVFAPITLFAAAKMELGSLFIFRYLAWFLPGYVLVLALALGVVSFRSQLVVAVVVSLVLVRDVISRQWSEENWRGALKFVNDSRKNVSTPVLFYSGLVELQSARWLGDKERTPYLTSVTSAYRVDGDILAISPNLSTPELLQYFNEKVVPVLSVAPEFYLIASNSFLPAGNAGVDVGSYYRRLLAPYGVSTSEVREFGAVTVVRLINGQPLGATGQ